MFDFFFLPLAYLSGVFLNFVIEKDPKCMKRSSVGIKNVGNQEAERVK